MLWLVAAGVGALMGMFMYAAKTQEIAAWREKEEQNVRRAAEMKLHAAAAEAARETLPELSAADNVLVEKLVHAYPGYLPRREGVVRDIGRELNSRGGNNLMLSAHAEIARRLGGVAARELESAWDGIGEWQG